MIAHDGGCLCGAIRYRVTGEPDVSAVCACRDCQYASGGAPAHLLVMHKNQLEILRGRPRAYWNFAESGNRIGRYYCETCATPLFQENAARRDVVMVRVGSLDDPSAFPPQAVVWTSSAQPWMTFDADLPTFEREPPETARSES